MEKKLGKTTDYTDSTLNLSIDLISTSINNLLQSDRTGGANYIYFPHFSWLEKNATKWSIFYKYLPDWDLSKNRGAGRWDSKDWINLSSSAGVKVGDIMSFVNFSGQFVYTCVYGGDNYCYGSNYIVNSKSAKCVKLSIQEIISYTGATDYKITRITEYLVKRHKGSSITT